MKCIICTTILQAFWIKLKVNTRTYCTDQGLHAEKLLWIVWQGNGFLQAFWIEISILAEVQLNYTKSLSSIDRDVGIVISVNEKQVLKLVLLPVTKQILLLCAVDQINWLTRWSRVFLEKLAGRQLVKKFPVFYGTRRFISRIHRPYLAI
jgi:hypothetical protein